MAFLAREIKPQGRLTVITASVPVTQIAFAGSRRGRHPIGRHHPQQARFRSWDPSPNRCCAASTAASSSSAWTASTPISGLTTTNMLEASLNRAMIDAAQKVVVLADSSKFGRRGFQQDPWTVRGPDHHRQPGAAALPRPAARAGDRGDGGGGLRSRRGTSRFHSRGYAPPGGRECGTGGRNSAARSVSSFRESYSLSRALQAFGIVGGDVVHALRDEIAHLLPPNSPSRH